MVSVFTKFMLKPLRGFWNTKETKQVYSDPSIYASSSTPVELNYPELKTLFDKTFILLEDNFSQEHPEKHYLRNALNFKLPNTERIDTHKQEISFSTYNTLFARTVADFMQREGLANVSVNTRNDPAKVILTQLNSERIEALYKSLQQTRSKALEQPGQKSFVTNEEERKTTAMKRGHEKAFGVAPPSHAEKVKRQRTEAPDISSRR